MIAVKQLGKLKGTSYNQIAYSIIHAPAAQAVGRCCMEADSASLHTCGRSSVPWRPVGVRVRAARSAAEAVHLEQLQMRPTLPMLPPAQLKDLLLCNNNV